MSAQIMKIEDVVRRIGEVGIIPVIRAATVDEALRAVEAIGAGGIPVVEITMTVPNAASAAAPSLGPSGIQPPGSADACRPQ